MKRVVAAILGLAEAKPRFSAQAVYDALWRDLKIDVPPSAVYLWQEGGQKVVRADELPDQRSAERLVKWAEGQGWSASISHRHVPITGNVIMVTISR